MPNDRFHIRDATLTDLPEIVAIYNSTIPGRMATADTEPVTVADRMAWFQRHQPAEHPLWVVEDEEKIAGWLSFETFYGRPAYHATVEISIYIAEASRGRGIGRFLLGESVRRAPELCLKTLLGFIFSHNTPSLALFAALGFEVWGQLPNVAEMDGVEYSLTIMGKRVG